MRIVHLGQRWGGGPFGKFNKLLSESEARKAYVAGTMHGALIEQDGKPYAAVQFGINRFVEVSFLDRFRREWLIYSYSYDKDEKMLFLRSCNYRQYVEDGLESPLKSAELYEFKRNGRLTVTIYDPATKDRKIGTGKTVDVSDLWEAYPEFGQYAAILRMERGPTSKLKS